MVTPIIEEWVSDSEEEDVPQAKIEKKTVKSSFAKINFVKSKEQVKSPRKTTVKQAHSTDRRPIDNKTTTKNSNFNQRVNTVSGKNVNTARPKSVVNAARPKAVLNVVKGNQVNAVKASACWVWKSKTKVIDHVSKHNSASTILKRFDYIDAQGRSNGCSRHMTGNMSYLTDFEEIDEGYIAFGGNPKGGKITGRATKDETSGILKSFISGVENLIDQRVKVIRCDNGTEFKNKEMNQVCERKGNGPNWLFDIDTLTKSMNYKPVITGNQSNGNAGTKACDDAGKAKIETIPGKDYILLPLWPADLPFSQNSKSSLDAGFKPSGDNEKKVTEELGKEGGDSSNDQEKEDNVNNNNNVNAAK
ncbi:putative ribonuclease H-like domain-containing protein [Tanacetum coccineum]